MLRSTMRLFCVAAAIAAAIVAGGAARAQSNTTLAATPPMGWNSWNHFHGGVSDAIVRAEALAMVKSGMKAAGYRYINIDDTWEGPRDASGNITSNSKFPDMKALCDYVHSLGLKIGIYSSPGPTTCAGYPASWGHEQQDADTYAAWGIDYLKFDWCSAGSDYPHTRDGEIAAYTKMHDALVKTGRPIVFSLCQYGEFNVWEWGPSVGGNLWRTTGDISDDWNRMCDIGFNQQNDIGKYAGPGHWNDPDMLEVGNGGMTDDEYRTHFSLWCLLAAPLIAGNDLSTMSPATTAILTNREVIAVDQDVAGIEGHRVKQDGQTEVWMKPMHDGSVVVGLFNRADSPQTVSFTTADLGITKSVNIRDLWAHKRVARNATQYSVALAPHACALLRLTPR